MRKTADCTLFERPDYRAAWRPHIRFGPPMFGVLQSKTDDVKYEMNYLRRMAPQGAFIQFVGGDGLSIMRMNYIIAHDPWTYLDTAPMMIPVQGEAPHGTHHLHHADWRLYWPLIQVCAQHLDNKQAVKDPTVSDFNRTFYFRLIMTRAVSEYINEIAAAGGPDTDLAPQFVRAAEANLDLAWLVHWLYDGAFLVLQWKQSVRSNDSHTLDLLWREFLSLAKTSQAHKTHYAPMAVLRVFWGMAMTPKLSALYHSIRTLPMGEQPGTCVGWDHPCENLHRAITLGVSKFVSAERISRFIAQWPFLEMVSRGLRHIIWRMRGDRKCHMKDMDQDVQKLKELFRRKVGTTWAEASRPNTSRPQLIGAGWRGRPWVAMQMMMNKQGSESLYNWMRSILDRYTGFFPWQI